nr:hypothetical protein BaRGS_003931 [Batillaria attramentaria]
MMMEMRMINPEIFLDYDCDDIRFFKPPAFTLEHFVAEVADHSRMPMTRVRQIMYSKHNVKKLTKLLAEELHRNPDPKINTINFDPEDITPLSRTIVYLNLSFNDFMYLPMEILDLWQLEVLKLRDNPLVELPSDINRLINLRVLVVSYCLLTTLPPGLFTLESLCHLSVAYNKLTFIPDEIKYLK